MINIEDICAIIVVYNPSNVNKNIILKNCSVFSGVIVYDNSEDEMLLKNFKSMLKNNFLHDQTRGKEVIILGGKGNVGLSKAFNFSIKTAENNGYKYVILLDQDTYFPQQELYKLLKDYEFIKKIKPVGAIGPSKSELSHTFYDFLFDGRFEWRNFYNGADVFEVHDLINSGMLIEISVFNLIGGFDENVFLDNSDRSLSLRLRLKDLRLFISRNALISHNIGEKLASDLMIKIYYRDPKREYFVKDLMNLLFVAYQNSIEDLLLILLLFTSKFFGIVFFKDKRKERLYYFFKGVKESHLLNKVGQTK